MTNEEAKQAFLKRTPIIHNGIEYLCISAIIYKIDKNNELLISAELLDRSKRGVTIARVKDISLKNNQ